MSSPTARSLNALNMRVPALEAALREIEDIEGRLSRTEEAVLQLKGRMAAKKLEISNRLQQLHPHKSAANPNDPNMSDIPSIDSLWPDKGEKMSRQSAFEMQRTASQAEEAYANVESSLVGLESVAEAMKYSLKEQASRNVGLVKTTMARLFRCQGDFLVSSIFCSWKDVPRQAQAAKEARQRRNQALATGVLMITAHHKKLLASQSFRMWDLVVHPAPPDLEAHMTTKKILYNMRERALKRVRMLWDFQEQDLQKRLFDSWKEIAVVAKLNKDLESFKQRMAQTRKTASENVCKVVSKLEASQDEMLVRIILDLWRKKILATVQEERAREMKEKDKSFEKTLRQVERAFAGMTGLVAAQRNLVVRSVLKVWKDVCMEAHQLKVIESLQSETQKIEELQKERKHAVVNLLGGWLGASQNERFISAVVHHWHTLSFKAGQQRNFGNLNKALRGNERAFASMIRIIASQDHLIVRTVLQTWKDVCVEARHKKELEDFQSASEERNKMEKERKNVTVSLLVASNDDQMRVYIFGIWKEFQREMQEKNKSSKKALRCKEHASGAMTRLATSQDKLLIMSVLHMWKDARHLNELQSLQSLAEKKRQRERECKWAVVTQFVACQERLFIGAAVKLWQEICSREIIERKLEMVQIEMKEKSCSLTKASRASVKTAVERLVFSQDKLFLFSAFQYWKFATDCRRDKELQRFLQALKQKSTNSVIKILEQHDDESVIKQFLQWWKEVHVNEMYHRKSEELQREKNLHTLAKKQRALERERKLAAAVQFGAFQDTLSMTPLLQAWKESCADARHLKELQNLRSEADQRHKREKACKYAAVTKLWTSHDSLLLMSVLQMWNEVHSEEMNLRKLQAIQREMQEKNNCLRQAHRLSVFTAVTGLVGQVVASEDNLTNLTLFTAWKDSCTFARHLKELQNLRSEADQQRKREKECIRQTHRSSVFTAVTAHVRQAMASQDNFTIVSFFSAWKDSFVDARHLKELQNLRSEADKRRRREKQCKYHASVTLFNTQDSVILMSVLQSWKEIYSEEVNLKKLHVIQREMQEKNKYIRQAQAQKSNVSKAVTGLVGQVRASQDNLTIVSLLTAWKKSREDAVHLKKLQNLRSEADKQHKREKECKYAAVTKLWTSQDNLLVMSVLQIWKEVHSEEMNLRKLQVIQREMQEKKRCIRQACKSKVHDAVTRLVASQDDMTIVSLLLAWKESCADARHLKEIQNLRSEADQQHKREKECKYAAVTKLWTSHDSLLLMSVLQMWKEGHSEEMNLRKLQAIQREMQEKSECIRQTHKSKVYEAVTGLLASRDNLTIMSLLVDWKESCADARHLKELQNLRSEADQQRKREKECKYAAVRKLWTSHDSLLLMSVLQMWKEGHSEEMNLRKLQAIQREMQEKNNCLRQEEMNLERQSKYAFVAQLAACQDNLFIMILLASWKEVHSEGIYVRKLQIAQLDMQDQIRKTSEQQVQAAMKGLAEKNRNNLQVLGGSVCKSLRSRFSLTVVRAHVYLEQAMDYWKKAHLETMYHKRIHELHEEIHQKLTCLKATNKKRLHACAHLLMEKHDHLTIQSVLKAWQTMCIETRHLERLENHQSLQSLAEKRQQQERELKYVAVVQLGAFQDNLVILGALQCWKEYVVRKLHKQKKEEVLHASFLLLTASHDSILTGCMFKLWKEFYAEARHLKGLDSHQSLQSLAEKRQQQERERKYAAVMQLGASQDNLVILVALQLWRDLCTVESHWTEVQSLQTQIEGANGKACRAKERALIAANGLVDSQANLSLLSLLKAWKHICTIGRHLQQVQFLENLQTLAEKKQSDMEKRQSEMEEEHISFRKAYQQKNEGLLLAEKQRKLEKDCKHAAVFVACKNANPRGELKFIFNAWHNLSLMTSRLNQIKELQNDFAEREIQIAQKTKKTTKESAFVAANAFVANRNDLILGMAFRQWMNICTKAFHQKYLQTLQNEMEKKNKMEEHLQKVTLSRERAKNNVLTAVYGLASCRESLLLGNLLRVWKDHRASVFHQKYLRTLQNEAEKKNEMKENLQKVKLSQERAKNNLLAAVYRLVAPQHSYLLATVLKMWNELRSSASHEKHLQTLQNEIKEVGRQQRQKTRGLTSWIEGMWMASWDRWFVRAVFKGWKDMQKKARQKESAEHLFQTRMQQMRKQASAAARSSTLRLVMAADVAFVKAVVNMWKSRSLEAKVGTSLVSESPGAIRIDSLQQLLGMPNVGPMDAEYLRKHNVNSFVAGLYRRMLKEKPLCIQRFSADYFSGALQEQKRLVLISSDAGDVDTLRDAVKPYGDMGARIVSAVWEFDSDPKALLGLVKTLRSKHGVFKTVAMCCHGERLIAEGSQVQKWLITRNHGVDIHTTKADEGVNDVIRTIADSTSVRVDLLSCNLASSKDGCDWIERWEAKTKINFAASTNIIGDIEQGGNWVLETDGIAVDEVYFDKSKLQKWRKTLYARYCTDAEIRPEPEEECSNHVELERSYSESKVVGRLKKAVFENVDRAVQRFENSKMKAFVFCVFQSWHEVIAMCQCSREIETYAQQLKRLEAQHTRLAHKAILKSTRSATLYRLCAVFNLWKGTSKAAAQAKARDTSCITVEDRPLLPTEFNELEQGWMQWLSQLPEDRKSKVLSYANEAEEAYMKVEVALGGRQAIEQFRVKSQELQDEVRCRLGDKSAWRHDVGVYHLGLRGLLTVGKTVVKPQFDALVKDFAQRFGAEAVIPDVKDPERSRVKVAVRYGGDASQLSDIVRATLKFKFCAGVLTNMYAAVSELVYMSKLNGVRASVTLFADRFQKPFNGGYKDLLCLIKINGFACELKLNIDAILDIKESLGRMQYGLTQKLDDELVNAAMKCDLEALTRSLGAQADPNASSEISGLTALHFAAQHGNLEMVNALLSHGANAFAQDQEGWLPIHRGILLGYHDVVETLVCAMESSPIRQLHRPLDGDLAAASLEKAPHGESLPIDLLSRVVKLEASLLPEGECLVHRWAATDRSEAFSAARRIGLEEAVGANDAKDKFGSAPLDLAIEANASGIAHELLKAGCRISKPYSMEDCSPKLKEVLSQFQPLSPFRPLSAGSRGEEAFRQSTAPRPPYVGTRSSSHVKPLFPRAPSPTTLPSLRRRPVSLQRQVHIANPSNASK